MVRLRLRPGRASRRGFHIEYVAQSVEAVAAIFDMQDDIGRLRQTHAASA
jgi:hypothetical protein